jgi:hypothetical protein
MLPLRAQSCSECGYQFVVQIQPPRIPEATAGDLEQIDDRSLLDAEQLRRMPYRRMLDWCRTDDIRLELARRAKRLSPKVEIPRQAGAAGRARRPLNAGVERRTLP